MVRSAGSKSLAYWSLRILAVIIVLCGLIMSAGGVWLISLGGPWYYFANGAGLILAGALLYAQRLAGVVLYWLAFVASVAWTVTEVGLDPARVIPRVSALGVIALLTLIFIPMLIRSTPRQPEGR